MFALGRTNMLFQAGVGADLFSADPKPREFSETLYICPVPLEELRPFLEAQPKKLKPDSTEYKRFQLIKRAQLHEVYNCLGALLFALVNVDAIKGMRQSRAILSTGIAADDPISLSLDSILSDTETYISRLAQYPADQEACKAISDAAQCYNQIVREQVGPRKEEFRISPRDFLKTFVRYGVTRHYDSFDTYESIMGYMADAGFGVSHFAWSRERGEERMTDHAADSLKIHLTTRSGVLFHMRPRPDADRTICDLYGISESALYLPPEPVQPIEVFVSTRGAKTVHADRLDVAFRGVKTSFPAKKVGDKETLLYCPSPRCLEEIGIAGNLGP